MKYLYEIIIDLVFLVLLIATGVALGTVGGIYLTMFLSYWLRGI